MHQTTFDLPASWRKSTAVFDFEISAGRKQPFAPHFRIQAGSFSGVLKPKRALEALILAGRRKNVKKMRQKTCASRVLN
jgi:hypothetical protein